MTDTTPAIGLTRDEMARRVALDIPDGSYVNLGIGIPERVAAYLPEGREVIYHTENGLLGMGPFPYEGEEDPQLINAGKQTVTVVSGGSFFDSATSFAMIRGGHVDLAILGALQVGMNGDLANWWIPDGKMMGIGGAMDLASGAKRILVLTRHVTKSGEPKLLETVDYPLTAQRCVDRVVTDLAILDVEGEGFRLVELAPGVTEDEVREATGAPLL